MQATVDWGQTAKGRARSGLKSFPQRLRDYFIIIDVVLWCCVADQAEARLSGRAVVPSGGRSVVATALPYSRASAYWSSVGSPAVAA